MSLTWLYVRVGDVDQILVTTFVIVLENLVMWILKIV